MRTCREQARARPGLRHWRARRQAGDPLHSGDEVRAGAGDGGACVDVVGHGGARAQPFQHADDVGGPGFEHRPQRAGVHDDRRGSSGTGSAARSGRTRRRRHRRCRSWRPQWRCVRPPPGRSRALLPRRGGNRRPWLRGGRRRRRSRTAPVGRGAPVPRPRWRRCRRRTLRLPIGTTHDVDQGLPHHQGRARPREARSGEGGGGRAPHPARAITVRGLPGRAACAGLRG